MYLVWNLKKNSLFQYTSSSLSEMFITFFFFQYLSEKGANVDAKNDEGN